MLRQLERDAYFKTPKVGTHEQIWKLSACLYFQLNLEYDQYNIRKKTVQREYIDLYMQFSV